MEIIKSMMRLQTKKIAYIGVFLSLSLIISYIESQIPVFVSVPGVKLGIANTVTVIVLYMFGVREALTVGILRVVISGILFSNLFSVVYGVSGCVLSILTMFIVKKLGKFSMTGVSFTGGIFHNVGQVLVAALIMEQISILDYIPVLIISGGFFGALTGMLCYLVYKRLETYVRL